MESPPSPKPHALVLPLPSQGHILPHLRLSIHLAATRGWTITFVNTQLSHASLLASQAAAPPQHVGLDIRFVSIPDGMPPGIIYSKETTLDSFLMVVEGMKRQTALDTLIESLKLAEPPLCCVISDVFLPWTQTLADRHNIPRVIYFPGSVTWLYMDCLVQRQRLCDEYDFTTEQIDEAISSHLFTHEEIKPFLQFLDDPRLRNQWFERLHSEKNASCILANSFQDLDLECAARDALRLRIPIRLVGPLLPAFIGGNKSLESWVGGGLYREKEDCLLWLDKQAKSSVLYISFGSKAIVSAGQLEEVALGIEATKQPFLWVSRDEHARGKARFPEGFQDRTKEQGLIVSWAPQLSVLSHPAIGGFLTHCGWNSTMESVLMGIPMLCWPVFADQPLNYILIVKKWKVGLGFERREDGWVERGKVERAVRALMEGEEGQEVRERMHGTKELARRAVAEGGSSFNDFQAFVCEMEACISPKP